MRNILIISASGLSFFAMAQSPLFVLESAWSKLSLDEQHHIQSTNLVSPIRDTLAGIIIDNQGANNSTPGNSSGSGLGGSIASAAYIDNALKPNGNYSAKSHLASIIVGNIIGSSLNQEAKTEYQFRYAIKSTGGDISYHDQFSSTPFRHPVGVCVLLPDLRLSPNQDVCIQTADLLREKYVNNKIVGHAKTPSEEPQTPVRAEVEFEGKQPQFLSEKVLCKTSMLAPIQTTSEKCKSINGEVIK